MRVKADVMIEAAFMEAAELACRAEDMTLSEIVNRALGRYLQTWLPGGSERRRVTVARETRPQPGRQAQNGR
jgi:hypothetical protein